METIENPGSLNSFKEENPETQDREYFELLGNYRISQAERLGVSPEQLHYMGSSLIHAALNLTNGLEGKLPKA